MSKVFIVFDHCFLVNKVFSLRERAEEYVSSESHRLYYTIIGFEVDNSLPIHYNSEYFCKVCKTSLNAGETPCWKCGTNDPTN